MQLQKTRKRRNRRLESVIHLEVLAAVQVASLWHDLPYSNKLRQSLIVEGTITDKS
jgi:hypothetical protein